MALHIVCIGNHRWCVVDWDNPSHALKTGTFAECYDFAATVPRVRHLSADDDLHDAA